MIYSHPRNTSPSVDMPSEWVDPMRTSEPPESLNTKREAQMPKTQEPHTIEISKLQPGDMFMLTGTRRMAKVVGPDVVTVMHKPTRENGGQGRIEEIPAVRVNVTVPTVMIDGMVSKKQAKAGQNILEGLLGLGEDDEYDNRVWQELWSTRQVGRIVKNKGGVPEVSDSLFRAQVYCNRIDNMSGKPMIEIGENVEEEGQTLRSSGILSSEIIVTDLYKTKMSGDPWALNSASDKPEEKVA